MPELPEVETVKRGLSSLLPDRRIMGEWHDWHKGFPNAPSDVAEFLVDSRVTAVKRRAKVLIIELSSNYCLVIHLKMTGQLVYVAGGARFGAGHPNDSLIGQLPDKSTRVIFCLGGKDAALEPNARKQRSTQGNVLDVHRLSTGAANTAVGQEHGRSFGLCPKAGQCDAHLYFNDQRKFGWVRLLPTAEVSNIDFFRKFGPEPLAADFLPNEFTSRLMRRPKSRIKPVLLDQTVIAGVGNIYADESLFAAKIHPESQVQEVPKSKLKVLYDELRAVMELSIEKGGSSDRNYVDAEGNKGSYLSFANVFRRDRKPCPSCGTMINKIRVAGRGTHVCNQCQKLYKAKGL